MGLGLACYAFSSSTMGANLMIGSLEQGIEELGEEPMRGVNRAVLLLGGGETDTLRALEAIRIYRIKEGDLEIIISGRDPLREGDQSGMRVKEFLMEQGVAEQAITLEPESRTTYENAENVRDFVGRYRFFLVTSAYHTPRAFMTFKNMGMNPVPAPTDYKVKDCCTLLDFLPSPSNLLNSDRAVHEHFGIWYYRVEYFGGEE